jgi:hypothetical protein
VPELGLLHLELKSRVAGVQVIVKEIVVDQVGG